MFNVKDYNTIYKTYINYILNNIYTLFFDVVKYQKKLLKRNNYRVKVQNIKLYFNLLSIKSIDKINYNSYYLLSYSTMYYSFNVPLKFIFNDQSKSININYNILNIPKVDATGEILINGFNRTPVLHLKSIIKRTSTVQKKRLIKNYLINLTGFNYMHVSVSQNKYVYVKLNDLSKLDLSEVIKFNSIHKNFIKLTIFEIIEAINDKFYNDYNDNVINSFFTAYNKNCSYADIISVINKFINAVHKKITFINSDSFINKNVNSICDNMFNLIKKSLSTYHFTDPKKHILHVLDSKTKFSNIPLFRENFLLNPSLHYTNQLNLLSCVQNKFKLNIFGYSTSSTSTTFAIPKYLRQVQYFYLNFINILYTVDGEKCGILSTITTNTIEQNKKLKTVIINKQKFLNNIYLDQFSKNLNSITINNYNNLLKKSYNFKINHVEVIENGEFKIVKLDKHSSNSSLTFYNIFNITELLIPFLLNNDMCRSLMGSKMHTQAVPLIHSNPQYVYTKYNQITNLISNKCIISSTSGIIVLSTNYKITILDDNNRYVSYYLSPYNIHDYNYYTRYRPVVWEGEKSNIGTILAIPSDAANCEFTLGFNNFVNYSFYYGYEHEDAIVLNKNVAYNDMLTSLEFDIDDIDLSFKKKKYIETILIDNKKKIFKIIIRIISNLKKQKREALKRAVRRRKRRRKIKKIVIKSKKCLYSDQTDIKKLVKYECTQYSNFVRIGSNLNYANFKLFLVSINNINVGDKLCGRHGNKGTISKIIEIPESPYTSEDKLPNIITSPIGAASRMNVGQFIEGYIGNTCDIDNVRIKSPINLHSSDMYSSLYVKSVSNKINNRYVKLKSSQNAVSVFRDFKTGYKLKGFTHHVILYFFKLMHTSKSKFRYRCSSSKLVQYVHGESKEQKFGEMEVWSLEAHGASYNLKEMSLLKTNIKFVTEKIMYDYSNLLSKTFTDLIAELKAVLVSIKFNNKAYT